MAADKLYHLGAEPEKTPFACAYLSTLRPLEGSDNFEPCGGPKIVIFSEERPDINGNEVNY